METIWQILRGDFFWGIIVGLLISLVGGWYQAFITQRSQRKERIEVIKSFCIDLLGNLQRYAGELSKTRQHGQQAPKSLFVLIDHELTAYGRQRDFLFVLTEDVRVAFREFMNEIALKRIPIQTKIEKIEEIFRFSADTETAGDAPKASRIRNTVDPIMKELANETDDLISVLNKATNLRDKFKIL